MWLNLPNIKNKIQSTTANVKDKISNKISTIKENHADKKAERRAKQWELKTRVQQEVHSAKQKIVEVADFAKDTWDRLTMIGDMMDGTSWASCDQADINLTLDDWIADFVTTDKKITTAYDKTDKLWAKILTRLQQGSELLWSIADDKLWEHATLVVLAQDHPQILLSLYDRVQERITQALMMINTQQDPDGTYTDELRGLKRLTTRLTKFIKRDTVPTPETPEEEIYRGLDGRTLNDEWENR